MQCIRVRPLYIQDNMEEFLPDYSDPAAMDQYVKDITYLIETVPCNRHGFTFTDYIDETIPNADNLLLTFMMKGIQVLLNDFWMKGDRLYITEDELVCFNCAACGEYLKLTSMDGHYLLNLTTRSP